MKAALLAFTCLDVVYSCSIAGYLLRTSNGFCSLRNLL